MTESQLVAQNRALNTSYRPVFKAEFKLKILSYNVLADVYAKKVDFEDDEYPDSYLDFL